MSSPKARNLCLASCLILLSMFAAAQSSNTGSIEGVVVDATNAVVEGASIEVVNVDTSVRCAVVSDGTGHFQVLQLAPGSYRATASSKTFAASVIDAAVEIGRTTRLNIVMRLGTAHEEVEVTVDAPVVNATQPDFSTNVDQEAIDRLPLNGRRWSNIALLTPATTTDGNFGLISFRGVSGLLNNSTVDGADNNQAFFGEERGRTRISSVISQSSIREFQVNTANFSAEYGRAAGAVINSVTKSGTNNIHGSAFYYIRDNALGATNPFSKLTTKDKFGAYETEVVKPSDDRQQFGMSIGGPAIKNRLFYFFTWDQQRRDFPALATAADPSLFDLPTAKELTTIKAVLPVAMKNDAAATTAFNQGLDFLRSLTGEVPRRADQLIVFPKVDWVITPNHTFSASYNRMRWDSPGGAETRPVYNLGVASFGGDNVNVDNFVVRLSSALKSNLANDARVLYSRDNEYQVAHPPAPQEPSSGPYGNSPQVSMASSSYGLTFGQPTTQSRNKYPDEKRWQVADSASYSHGRHLFKAGVDISRVSDDIDHLYQGGSGFTYSNRAAFIADYTQYLNWNSAGYTKDTRSYSTYVQAFGPSSWSFRTLDLAYFVQDEWRAARRLTVNLGLRYDRQRLPAAQIANPLVPATSNVPSDGNNFGPRFGFAWDVFGDGNTTVRGGYGLFYGRITNSTISSALMNTGGSLAQRSYLWRGGGAAVASPGAPVYPATLAPSSLDPMLDPTSTVDPDIAFFAPNMQNPQIHQADLIIERQVTPTTMISATFLVTFGRELPNYADTNLDPASVVSGIDPLDPSQPNPANKGYTFFGGPFDGQKLYVPYFTARLDPRFGQMTEIVSNVNSRYNGLVLQAKRRFSRDFSFNLGYTWSHSVDNGQNSVTFTSGNNTLWPGPLTYYLGHPIQLNDPNKGTSNYEVRQKFVGSLFYLSRVSRDSSKWIRWTFDGWGLTPILHFSSGRPYSEYISGTPAAIPASCDGCLGLFGTGGVQRLPFLERNSHKFPSIYNMDMRASKRVYVREGQYVEFVAEAFNLLNHVNVTDVEDEMYYFSGATLMSNGTFGTPSAAGNTIYRERQIQLALKYRF